MAHVEKRKPQTEGGVTRYRVRYVDPLGTQRSKTFARKVDADRFAAAVETDKARGVYVDPGAGRLTLRVYADQWLEGRTFDESTREATELRLRLHVYPTLGDAPLAAIRPSQVQAWVRGLQQSLAPRYVRVVVANLSQILSAAVDDERIGKNPCRAGSVRLPKVDDTRLRPWTLEEVVAVRDALPARVRLVATLCSGLGLRQGEAFGLAVEDVDFLRGVVHVRRQVKILRGRQVYALPKGRKVRDVPLPQSVALAMAAHLQAHPALPVALPWEAVDGREVEARLLLSTRERTALQRNYVNAKVWKPAVTAAAAALREAKVETALAPTREHGMHALRHFYASVLLDAGESVRALADYLGHADPGFTLRVYTHLMPSSEDRTKKAVDRLFGSPDETADGLATSYGSP
jgi:integrase